MDGPVQLCKNFNEENTILDFSKLEFIQLDNDEVVLNGTVHISAEINSPLAVSIYIYYICICLFLYLLYRDSLLYTTSSIFLPF